MVSAARNTCATGVLDGDHVLPSINYILPNTREASGNLDFDQSLHFHSKMGQSLLEPLEPTGNPTSLSSISFLDLEEM